MQLNNWRYIIDAALHVKLKKGSCSFDWNFTYMWCLSKYTVIDSTLSSMFSDAQNFTSLIRCNIMEWSNKRSFEWISGRLGRVMRSSQAQKHQRRKVYWQDFWILIYWRDYDNGSNWYIATPYIFIAICETNIHNPTLSGVYVVWCTWVNSRDRSLMYKKGKKTFNIADLCLLLFVVRTHASYTTENRTLIFIRDLDAFIHCTDFRLWQAE